MKQNELTFLGTSLLTILLLITFLAIFPAIAFSAPQKILLVETMEVPVVTEHAEHIFKNLGEMGFNDEEKYLVERLNLKGNREKGKLLLAEALANEKPLVVVTVATMATQLALEAVSETDIPIVFCVVADPVGSGIVKQVGVPSGTNVTGLVYTINRMAKLDAAIRVLRSTSNNKPLRFGVVNSTYPSSRGDISEFKSLAAGRDDVEFVSAEIPYQNMPEGLDAMLTDVSAELRNMKGKVDYYWQVPGPLGEVDAYTKVQLEEGDVTIAMANTTSAVKLGALMAFNVDYAATGEETAMLVKSVLNGVDPGTIAVLPPKKFMIAFNLTTAKELGVVIPSALLRLAGENLYH